MRRLARATVVALTGVVSVLFALNTGGLIDAALARADNALTSAGRGSAVTVMAEPAHDEMDMQTMARSPSD